MPGVSAWSRPGLREDGPPQEVVPAEVLPPLQTNVALVAPLLRLENNHCHIEESEHVLKKAHKYSELIILYEKKGLHEKGNRGRGHLWLEGLLYFDRGRPTEVFVVTESRLAAHRLKINTQERGKFYKGKLILMRMLTIWGDGRPRVPQKPHLKIFKAQPWKLWG